MPIDNTTHVQTAISEIGAYKIANACGIKGPSVYKWLASGRLPRTEWTGETDYATIISKLSDGKYSREQLLQLPTKPVVLPQPLEIPSADQASA